MSRPLTDQEFATFNAIREAPNVALVQTRFNGQETAVIAATLPDDDGTGNGTMYPLAVLVTDEMFGLIDNPMAEE